MAGTTPGFAHLRTRSTAVLAGLVLAAALLPGAGLAAAEVRDVDDACADAPAGPEFTDLGGYAPEVQEAIGCMAAYEVTVGYGDGTFRPGLEVRRYQMALFLARVLEYAAEHGEAELPDELPDPGFADVTDLSDEAQDAIALLAELEITTGTTATTFSPNATVNRRDMSRFIARIQAEVLDPPDGYYLDDLAGVDAFPDVPADEDAFGGAADIYALAEAGVVGGHADGTFRPFDPVIRAHMALFVMRHLDENVAAERVPPLADTLPQPTGQLSLLVDTLYDVETGEQQPLFDADPRDVFGLEEGEPLNGPAWSPDGERIALQSNGALGVLEVGASEPSLWVEAEDIAEDISLWGTPAWAPEGSRLATVAGGAVAIVDADDGAVLTEADAGLQPVLTTAAWSPTGDAVAYGTLNEDNEQLVRILDAETGSTEDLLVLDESGNAPLVQWSPDGAHLAFFEAVGRVSVVDAEGGTPQVLMEAAWAWLGDWLPDGSGVVAHSVDPHELVVLGVDGSRTVVLDADSGHLIPGIMSTVSVSPDGAWIAYDVGAAGGDEAGTFVVSVDGEHVVEVHELARRPFWRPGSQ